MQESEASRASGDLDTAAAGLERGIRIEPRNAQLWHDLAQIRLQQGQASLAEQLATKSLYLAMGNEQLLAKNRALIAEARRRQPAGTTEPDP
jgi:cytochrome c-type biogenesis protein CcmH/NrfG